MMTEEQRDEILNRLHADLDVSKNLLYTLKAQIIETNISNYPIFVASEDFIDLGKMVIDKKQLEIHWNFLASHLEEFVHKKIIAMDKVDAFRKVYKEHSKELCIFVLNDVSGDFVFLPA